MFHRKNKRTLSRRSGHRKSLFRNLSKALIQHERIRTTLPKAKDLRSIIEKMVTLGKKNSIHARRNLISKLGSNSEVQVEKIMSELSVRYKERPGGYTRIIKAGYRKGDNAPMAFMEFVK